MTRTIRSYSDPSKHYFLTINDETGQADDCQCPDCQIRRRQCKHQRDFNTEVRKAEVFNQQWNRFDVRSQAQRDARATARINMELALGW